ncbi:FAD-binding protein [Streptomyces yokosukanensis]|uniref:FAD-binding protein n=1 Tax=Streptomyces yokosukanensis TaxID=67386 RepID=A0A101NTL4_9ACTN|nr:FAD-binding protein [Streptomyces yokosukanensis]
MEYDKRTRTVGVIGAGPRGLSVVERLCANGAESGQPTVIHVVDPYLGTGGRVWHTVQPAELLMNTVASQVTMFTDPSVTCEGPISPGPSLYEWAKSVVPAAPSGTVPDRVRDEAADLGPDTYPSRAFYGHYLAWVVDHLVGAAPQHISVRLHRNRAVRLTETETSAQVLTLDDGTGLLLDCVVLAQGHADMPVPVGTELSALRKHARAHGLGYLSPGNPAEADLAFVGPGEQVALRGLGLNFFDVMALLTVGRGGEFHRADDTLHYRPSGKEPRILAGSRRGVPYHARGENQKGPFGRHMPAVLTPARIAALRERRQNGEQVDFQRHIWPLIDREVTAVYYATLISRRLGPGDAKAFLAEYTTLPVSRLKDEEALRRYGIGPGEHWDWDRIARPYGDRFFADPAEYQHWLLGYLRRDVAEARDGNVGSPLKAALDVLRDLRNEVRLAVDHAGITGESYRDGLQSWYTPLNAFVSIGPPLSRIEELIALIEAGVVEMVGPGMQVTAAPDGFVVSSGAVPGPGRLVTSLIEARLPDFDIRRTTDPLLRELVQRGACRPYLIPTGTDGHVETGGLAVTPRPNRLVDAAGQPHPYRFAYGVPTEAAHWATAAGIRPGVDSVILGDADAIARECLTVDLEQRRRTAALVGAGW